MEKHRDIPNCFVHPCV